jgi:carboxymethylenebutenolidase
MDARWETVDVGGSPMPVYVVTPDGPGPWAGVVVNMGLGGPEEVIRTHARRVAEAGFVAAAANYYHRQTDNIIEEVKDLPPGTPERTQRLMEKMGKLRDDEIVADGEAVVGLLRSLDAVRNDRIGILGFCPGGRITYLEATAIRGLSAVVPFYPAGLWTAWGDGPTAFERSSGIECPLLGLFGGDDANPSPEQVVELDAELTRLGVAHEFHSYAGAGHDFQNFNSSNFREQAAKESWPVAMGFLRQHLA